MQELDERGDLPPPWARFPEYTSTTIGWRMGYGEAYLDLWDDWVAGLPGPDATVAYLRRHPAAPRTWALHVAHLLTTSSSGAWRPTLDSVSEMGLVGDDVAFAAWSARIGGLGRPPWGAGPEPEGSPDEVFRYQPRTLAFWGRWAAGRRPASDREWLVRWFTVPKRTMFHWTRRPPQPPAGWEAFCVAAIAGSTEADRFRAVARDLRVAALSPADHRGILRLCLELAAAGMPPPPWDPRLPPTAWTGSYDRVTMTYADAWVLWVNALFDDMPTWRAYLEGVPAVPTEWAEVLAKRTILGATQG